MTVAIVGGLGRLTGHYTRLADEYDDLEIKVFNEFKHGLADRLAGTDGVILFTNVVSHNAAREVYRMARERGKQIVCSHSAGVSSARECLRRLERPSL